MNGNERKELSNFVREISDLLPIQISQQLDKGVATEVITEIINNSEKNVQQAVIVFLSAIKYLNNCKQNTFLQLSVGSKLLDFIRNNREKLIELGKSGRIQFTVPERAFPVLEVINRKIRKPDNKKPIAVIELGASFGLVGRCLLEPKKFSDNKAIYMQPEQKVSDNLLPIDYHLGIEVKIPDEKWILASEWTIEADRRLRNVLKDSFENERFKLIEGDAFDFDSLQDVRNLAEKHTLVILTSFIFFQIGNEKSEQLKGNIMDYVKKEPDRYWINQALLIHTKDLKDYEFLLQLNGEKIITLADDRCSNWEWVE